MDPKVLERKDAASRIRRLVRDGLLDVSWRTPLEEAAESMAASRDSLASASRRLGEETLAAIMHDRARSGDVTLMDPLVDAVGEPRRAGKGTFDGVGLTGGDPPILKVSEVNGGSSLGLTMRDVDGVWAEQGTARYFNDVAAKDSELAAQIEAYARRPDADPVTVARLRSGDFEVEYELIEVQPTRAGSSDSGIHRTMFDIDRERVDVSWPGEGAKR